MKHRSVRQALSGPAGFLVLLLFLRLLFLLAALDPEEERVMTVLDPAGLTWSRGPARPLYDREELYAGAAAEAIRRGLGLPLTTYRFMPYGSGSLPISLAAVPLFVLLGPYYLVFKILPLLVTLLGGLGWFLTVRAWLGRRAAWLFGLLYILAPPVLVRTALIAKGDHAEAMALIGAVLCLATQSVFARDERRRLRLAAASGFLAGLGVFVTYSTLPVLTAVGAVALMRTKARPRAVWLASAAGLIVGLLPWLGTVLATGREALLVYGRSLGSTAGVAVALGRMRLLVNQGLLAAHDLPGGPAPRILAAFLWLLSVILGWVFLARNIRRPFPLLVLAGTLAHLAAFCLAAPDASSRYLVPGYPLFLIAVLYAAVAGTDSKARRRWPWAGLCVAGILGLLSQFATIQGSRFPALRAPLSGVDWPLLGEIAGQKLPPGRIAALSPEVRPFFWVGFGKRCFWVEERSNWPRDAALAGEDRASVWEGIGISWVESDRPAEAGPFLRGLPEEDRLALRKGMALYGESFFAPVAAYTSPDSLKAFFKAFAPQDQPELRVSLARTLGVLGTQGACKPAVLAATSAGCLTAAEAQVGLGWSLYRGSGGRGGIRSWRPAGAGGSGGGTSSGQDRARLEVQQGLADAYGWHLERRSAGWILGGARDAENLAKDLARVAPAFPGPAAASCYRAAARAAAQALRDPSIHWRSRARRARWSWQEAIPERFQAAFKEGLQ